MFSRVSDIPSVAAFVAISSALAAEGFLMKTLLVWTRQTTLSPSRTGMEASVNPWAYVGWLPSGLWPSSIVLRTNTGRAGLAFFGDHRAGRGFSGGCYETAARRNSTVCRASGDSRRRCCRPLPWSPRSSLSVNRSTKVASSFTGTFIPFDGTSRPGIQEPGEYWGRHLYRRVDRRGGPREFPYSREDQPVSWVPVTCKMR